MAPPADIVACRSMFGLSGGGAEESRRVDPNTRDQFKKKLAERLSNPRVDSARLVGRGDRYKIKLRRVGYRLVCEVRADMTVVLAVGKRERSAVYRAAEKR